MVNRFKTKKGDNIDRDPATIIFADPDDCGKFGLDDIYIFNVHNGVDHFPGTKPRIPNFRDGVDQVFQTLVSAANICSNLKLSTEDKTVSVTINQAMDVIKSVGHNLNKLFIPTPLKNNPVFHHLKKENHPRSLEKPDRSNQNLPPSIVPVENCLQMMMSCSITRIQTINLTATGTVLCVINKSPLPKD